MLNLCIIRDLYELADKIVKEIIHIVLKQVDFNEYFLLLVVVKKKRLHGSRVSFH